MKISIKQVIFLLFIAVLTAGQNSFAATTGGLFLEFGYDFGGETLLEGYYTDGTTDEIKSHSGLNLAVGASAPISKVMLLSASIGYKYDSMNASNGSISLNRIPINLMAHTRSGNHFLGAGITHQKNVGLECEIDSMCDATLDFDDATGFIVEYNYNALGEMRLGLRYTKLSLTATGLPTVDASGVGVILGGRF